MRSLAGTSDCAPITMLSLFFLLRTLSFFTWCQTGWKFLKSMFFFFPPPANKQLSFTALRYCLFLLSLREHIYLTFIFPGKVKQTCVFFFSAVLLHIHAVTATFTRGSATVRTRYPTVDHRAAPRDKWPQIKRVRSPQHISGAVKVEFRFNKHGSRPLPLFGVSLCYQILCY